MEWRRRNRNTFSRVGLCLGRRYTDRLPTVNKAFDAVVAYHEEEVRVRRGGGSEARLERRRETLRATLARLEEL